MQNLKREAEENLRRLAENTYPGRGIVLGRAPDGQFALYYWIMGRSENSRNRVFVREGPVVRTEPFHAEQLADPSLVIYTAMNEAGEHHLVSNGAHTDTLCTVLGKGGTVQDALRKHHHEPDPPHYTPRIAGGITIAEGRGAAWLAIIRASPFDGERSDRFYFEYSDLVPGFGWCITTYRGDGTPLPTFKGEPFAVPLEGGGDELLGWIWYRLNERNRISLALKTVDAQSGERDYRIVNKYQ